MRNLKRFWELYESRCVFKEQDNLFTEDNKEIKYCYDQQTSYSSCLRCQTFPIKPQFKQRTNVELHFLIIILITLSNQENIFFMLLPNITIFLKYIQVIT